MGSITYNRLVQRHSHIMLTSDLVVTDSGSATKPGAEGAKTYALVASLVNDTTKRRIAANATTVPHELTVRHALSGSGFKQRCRSLVRFDLSRLDTDLDLTGGVVPTAACYLVLDRPIQSNGYITTAHLQTLVGAVVDVLCVSGQLDKILNMEA
jgi:hypothetical protein